MLSIRKGSDTYFFFSCSHFDTPSLMILSLHSSRPCSEENDVSPSSSISSAIALSSGGASSVSSPAVFRGRRIFAPGGWSGLCSVTSSWVHVVQFHTLLVMVSEGSSLSPRSAANRGTLPAPYIFSTSSFFRIQGIRRVVKYTLAGTRNVCFRIHSSVFPFVCSCRSESLPHIQSSQFPSTQVSGF